MPTIKLSENRLVELTDAEMSKRQFYHEDIGASYRNGWLLGYKECWSTIPSEAIAFVEWICQQGYYAIKSVHYKETCWYSNKDEKSICDSTEELFNIYQEQTKNNG